MSLLVLLLGGNSGLWPSFNYYFMCRADHTIAIKLFLGEGGRTLPGGGQYTCTADGLSVMEHGDWRSFRGEGFISPTIEPLYVINRGTIKQATV